MAARAAPREAPRACASAVVDALRVALAPIDASGTPSEQLLEGAEARGILGEFVVHAAHSKAGYDRLWKTRIARPPGTPSTGSCDTHERHRPHRRLRAGVARGPRPAPHHTSRGTAGTRWARGRRRHPAPTSTAQRPWASARRTTRRSSSSWSRLPDVAAQVKEGPASLALNTLVRDIVAERTRCRRRGGARDEDVPHRYPPRLEDRPDPPRPLG